MPKFVLDEDMPRSTGKLLRGHGYEVKDVRDCGLRGAQDQDIYQFAQEEQAGLLTADMGFGSILRFPLGEHWGIIIIHFPNEISTKEMNRQLLEDLKHIPEGDFKGNLIIIEPGRIRMRRKQQEAR